jgi:hypothetical protein
MIQIHARIIVSLYLIISLSAVPSGCCIDGKWPNSLSLRAIGMATPTINGFTTVPEQEAALEGLD